MMSRIPPYRSNSRNFNRIVVDMVIAQTETAEDNGATIGGRIRMRRRIRRMSLQELSERSGLSVALLSQIERNVSTPSLRSLKQVCEGLDMPIGWLFDGGEESTGVVLRAGSRRRLDFGPLKMVKELMSPDSVPEIQIMKIIIQPEGSSGAAPYNNPEGAKCGTVLSGRLGLHVNGRDYVLETGDSFAFRAQDMHRFWCIGDNAVEILWIVTPAVY